MILKKALPLPSPLPSSNVVLDITGFVWASIMTKTTLNGGGEGVNLYMPLDGGLGPRLMLLISRLDTLVLAQDPSGSRLMRGRYPDLWIDGLIFIHWTRKDHVPTLPEQCLHSFTAEDNIIVYPVLLHYHL